MNEKPYKDKEIDIKMESKGWERENETVEGERRARRPEWSTVFIVARGRGWDNLDQVE